MSPSLQLSSLFGGFTSKIELGSASGPPGVPGSSKRVPGASKKGGSPAKKLILGRQGRFWNLARTSPNRVLDPQEIWGAIWPLKMEPFSVKIEAGGEKRDFVKILLFLKRQHDFRGSDPPRIDPKSTPEAIRKTTSKKTRQKRRGSPQKAAFRAPGSILEFRRGPPKTHFAVSGF